MCHSVSCTLLHTRPWPPENRPHRGFVVRYGKTPCHPVSFLAAASLLLVLPAARVRTLCACALRLSLPLLPLPPVYFSIVYVSSTPSMLAGLAFFFRGSPARRLSGEYALPERVAAHGNRRASRCKGCWCAGERKGSGRAGSSRRRGWQAQATRPAARRPVPSVPFAAEVLWRVRRGVLREDHRAAATEQTCDSAGRADCAEARGATGQRRGHSVRFRHDSWASWGPAHAHRHRVHGQGRSLQAARCQGRAQGETPRSRCRD